MEEIADSCYPYSDYFFLARIIQSASGGVLPKYFRVSERKDDRNFAVIGEAIIEETPRGRFGNHVYGTFGRDFVTRDGRRVMVLALTPRQWRSLVEATALSGEFRNLEARLGLYFNDEGDRWRGRQEICELLVQLVVHRQYFFRLTSNDISTQSMRRL